FPKDVKALIAHGKNAGLPMELLSSVISINERQPAEMLRLLGKHHESLAGVRVAVLGLAFKPGTDDIRESPSLPVVAALQSAGAWVKAYDPIARHEAERVLSPTNLAYADSLAEAIDGAQAILIMTRWAEFAGLPDLLEGVDPQPVVIDGRRMLEPAAFEL